jgi:CheY-like chemotaxis protein
MSKKILLIEDDEVLSEMYRFRFAKDGYEMILAHDGEAGVKLAEEGGFDLILSDVFMPKMDGYQVLETLKKNKKTAAKKIYMLSNLGQDAEIQKAVDLGADGYLIKSHYTPSQLVAKVEDILGGKTVGDVKPEQRKKAMGRKKTGAGQNGEFARGSILLIEDEEALINMYRFRLEKEGYQVEVAENGAWGIKKAARGKFDLIILDMVMPAMNGYEALKKIRAGVATKDIPVLLLSNSAQEKDIEKAKQAGATVYLLKSLITPARLLAEVRKMIKK